MDSVILSNSILDSKSEQSNTFIMPDRLKDSYQLLDCLKTSSNKEIYLLSNQKEMLFILKRGTDKQIPLIKQEYQISKQLDIIPDFTIPECMDYWEEGDACYLLRTYIEGISLADYFERRLYLSDKEITDYMLKICEMIQLLHKQTPPIIHRDIKPENFIIQKGTGALYLIDFDTARVYTSDKSRDTLLVGTPSHAAPEQFGFSQSDVRTDIYALGKTLLYLTYGSTEIKNIKSSSISKPFQKIISRCTNFTPDKRYSDVSQLIRALKHYRRHSVFSKSYACQIGVAILILVFGIGLGFIGGSHYKKENSDKTQTVAISKSQSTEEQPTAKPENSTLSETIPPNGTSLFEQSGALECDFLQFQNQVNQIILDYYNGDAHAMTMSCEKLIEALYEDEAVNQVAGTDYDGHMPAPGEDFRAPIVQIRDNLAYRDQLLKQKLGSYEKYEDAIYANLNGYLTPSIINVESCLYLYATATGEESHTEYQGAISDILNNIRMAIEFVDEQEN